jgi:hypothetical protein
LTRRLAAIGFAAFVLAIGGCGGGDDSTDAGSDSTAAPDAPPGDGPTRSGEGQVVEPGRSGKRGDDAARQRGGDKAEQGEELKLDDREPAPPLKHDPERDSDLPTGPPTLRRDLSPQERQAYDTAEFFCKRAGIEGMRREYSVESTDAADVAREAARRYYARSMQEAVYSGCLAGLLAAK